MSNENNRQTDNIGQVQPESEWHSGKPTRTRTLSCRGGGNGHELTQIDTNL